MSTIHYSLIDDYVIGRSPSAADLNKRAQVLDTQLPAALALVGAGVLEGLQVSLNDGLSVKIAPGEAIARHSVYGHIYMRQATEEIFGIGTFAEDTDNYVFASIGTGTSGAPDTRYDGEPFFVANEATALDGAVLLARVTIASGSISAVAGLRRFAGSSAFLGSWMGNGRRVGANPLTGAPAVVPESLDIKLPAGSKYFIGGQEFALQEDEFLAVPASSTVWPVLSFDENGEVSAEFATTQPASGVGSIGKVVTDGTHVLQVNADFSADLIPDFQALYNLAKVLGSGDGEIDLSGYVKVETFNSLVQRVAALENTLTTGTPTLLNDYERIDSIAAGLDISLAEINALHPNYMDGSLLSDGLTGNGENRPPSEQQPDVNAGGNEPRGDE